MYEILLQVLHNFVLRDSGLHCVVVKDHAASTIEPTSLPHRRTVDTLVNVRWTKGKSKGDEDNYSA
jgi:hypothetical protein